jgi:hypothetical protein
VVLTATCYGELEMCQVLIKAGLKEQVFYDGTLAAEDSQQAVQGRLGGYERNLKLHEVVIGLL